MTDHPPGAPPEAAPPRSRKRVRRIDQSPMNQLIWIFELECGHEITKTSKSRPRNYTLTKVPGDVLQGPRFERCWRCEESKR